jgi:hypothetical protein
MLDADTVRGKEPEVTCPACLDIIRALNGRETGSSTPFLSSPD